MCYATAYKYNFLKRWMRLGPLVSKQSRFFEPEAKISSSAQLENIILFEVFNEHAKSDASERRMMKM